MKKTLLLIAMMLCCATTIFAQNDKISYQAVVRDTENKLVANKNVNVTVTITDADNHSYTQEFTDVQTNFNGMLSLMIGPDGENADWNNIHWNHANVVTTVTLAGVELGTLTMPLTAVPYALYADYAEQINPDATVVTDIYDKLGAKADTSKVYTRTIIDNKLGAKADTSKVYTRIIIDNKLDAKANTADLANVATSGSYNDLTNKPTIPAAQVNSDWKATSGVSEILNKPSIIDSIRAYMDTCTAVIKNNDLCTSIETCDNVALRYESNTFTQDNTFSSTISVPSNTTTFPTPSGKDYSNRADSSYAVSVRDLLAVFDSLNKTIESLKLMNDQLAERVAALESGSVSPISCQRIILDNIQSDFVVHDCDTLTGVLGADVKISIAAGATVTLDGVDINGSGTWSSGEYAGLTCEGNATIILKDGTTNTVKGFNSHYPGVFVPSGKTLTIQGETLGTGKLIARSNGNGAGIGGGHGINCGNITIISGVIDAQGGAGSAGIGSASGGYCGAITISGGEVTAAGGSSAAGIGSGNGKNSASSCGTITISGGTVTATGSDYGAAGIGGGYKSTYSSISITGGTVTATSGSYGAGIGSGEAAHSSGAITISGGKVTATGGSFSAGIGTATSGSCGAITIENTVIRVYVTKGYGAPYSIGAGYSDEYVTSSCGTVTIGGVTGPKTNSPYTYQP